MTPRSRKFSIAGIAVLAAAGLATGASGALADEGGGDRSEIRYVVDEGDDAKDGDCPGHGSSPDRDEATDPSSSL